MGRDVAFTVSGALCEEMRTMVMSGESETAPRVISNCPARLNWFQRKFSGCRGGPGTVSSFRKGALRFIGQYASESGFRLYGCTAVA